jgi:DNA (cytosine-5)-methyltransferase 1
MIIGAAAVPDALELRQKSLENRRCALDRTYKEHVAFIESVASGTMKPTFYEFFAGGGMARAGLEPDWQCLFANDIDPKKSASYVANWGDREFKLGDIFDLRASDLPGEADLAWASFPCQDLSLAGNGGGLDAKRSGAFWGFHQIIHALKTQGRAPKLLVLENVGGAVTSKDGRDFAAICRALKSLDYVYGAMMIDAVHFVPQSRARLFIVALRADLECPMHPCGDSPSPLWTTDALKRGYARLRPDLRHAWRWWRLPAPPEDETRRLLSLMSRYNLAKVEAAKCDGDKIVGTIYRRTRRDDHGARIQRAEARFDGVSGCLRTPAGGSSRQIVVLVEGDRIR